MPHVIGPGYKGPFDAFCNVTASVLAKMGQEHRGNADKKINIKLLVTCMLNAARALEMMVSKCGTACKNADGIEASLKVRSQLLYYRQ